MHVHMISISWHKAIQSRLHYYYWDMIIQARNLISVNLIDAEQNIYAAKVHREIYRARLNPNRVLSSAGENDNIASAYLCVILTVMMSSRVLSSLQQSASSYLSFFDWTNSAMSKSNLICTCRLCLNIGKWHSFLMSRRRVVLSLSQEHIAGRIISFNNQWL